MKFITINVYNIANIENNPIIILARIHIAIPIIGMYIVKNSQVLMNKIFLFNSFTYFKNVFYL